MTDRPVIFSAPMIRALLDGRKTMTRRLAWVLTTHAGRFCERASPWQKVKPGDQIWVKETHYRFGVWRKDGKTKTGAQRWRFKALDDSVMFMDTPPEPDRIGTKQSKGRPVGQWWKRPAIFMTRKCSRLTLTVTATKIERLQDISNEDAQAEGVSLHQSWGGASWWRVPGLDVPDYASNRPRDVFGFLWGSLHGDDSWHANPEVVALTFTVALRNIDAKEAA